MEQMDRISGKAIDFIIPHHRNIGLIEILISCGGGKFAEYSDNIFHENPFCAMEPGL
jgi:hypothetical protein